VSVPRFFAPAFDPGDDTVDLPRDEAEHLTRVLRLGVGDTVAVFNGRGQEFLARIVSAARRDARVQLVSRVEPAPEAPTPLTLVQAVLKGDKMDDVVRDAVMLGVAAIQPIVTKRAEFTVAALMRRLVDAQNSERIILLLQILDIIARSRDTKTICSEGLTFQYSPAEAERLNTIYQYILAHFTRPLSLEQVARIAHLSPNGFCRYFKSRIKKTFSRFLIEMRIGHACKLLAETDKPVAEICFECGFSNFSNFNRHFKDVAQRTPLSHRKYYQEIRRVRMKLSEQEEG